MNQENFGGATFEQKLKMLAIMSEKDQARSAENLLGFCENYCRKCPSYIGTSETRLSFCTLGKSAHIKEQKGCLCSQCPIARTRVCDGTIIALRAKPQNFLKQNISSFIEWYDHRTGEFALPYCIL